MDIGIRDSGNAFSKEDKRMSEPCVSEKTVTDQFKRYSIACGEVTKMSANEKLTRQALIDHDKVQPKLKAPPARQASRDGSKLSLSSKKSHHSGEQDRNGQPPTPKINLFKLVVATRAWQRLAKTSSNRQSEKVKPVVKLENTYKTEPDAGKTFSSAKVEELLKEILERRLKTFKYSADMCRLVTTELTADIKSKVKALDFPRYKIVCNVHITENKRQGLEIASRCIWNQKTDSFATYTYRNPTLIAVANVYGVYFE